jgi:hypothetical protein
MKKATIQTSLLDTPVAVNKQWNHARTEYVPTWDGIVRSVYTDSDGEPKYTIQGTLTSDRPGQLSEHYAFEFRVKA